MTPLVYTQVQLQDTTATLVEDLFQLVPPVLTAMEERLGWSTAVTPPPDYIAATAITKRE